MRPSDIQYVDDLLFCIVAEVFFETRDLLARRADLHHQYIRGLVLVLVDHSTETFTHHSLNFTEGKCEI